MKKFIYLFILLISCGPSLEEKNAVKQRLDNNLNEESSSYFKDMENETYITVKDIVKRKLKSPKSADFPLLDFKYENLGDNQHKIVGYVDAKNSYGAEIRTYYRITLKFNGGDWTDIKSWSIIKEEYE